MAQQWHRDLYDGIGRPYDSMAHGDHRVTVGVFHQMLSDYLSSISSGS